jgi:RsiW-degrading membrane proteinase PrsW (M82 family)
MRSDAAAVYLIGLGLGGVMSLVPLAILWFLDRRERETPWLFAVAFLWGAFIATGLALPLNNTIFGVVAAWLEQHPALAQMLGPDAVTIIGAPIAGPLVEEVTKGLGVLLLFLLLRAEFDNMRDGFVYGAVIGLGFTWFETALYVTKGYVEFGIPPWGMQYGWRYALFGLSGHAMFTGIFGALLGVARQTTRLWLRILAPIVGLALAIAAHLLNNALPLIFAIEGARRGETPPATSEAPPELGLIDAWIAGSIANLTIFLPFVAVMALALYRSGRWERRVIREELAGEVGRAVTAHEYDAVLRDGMFRTRRIDAAHPRLSSDMVEAQNELAFRKRRVKHEGNDPALDPLVAGWRTQIARLRRALES